PSRRSPPPAAPPCRPVRARPRRRDAGTARSSSAVARPDPWGRDETSGRAYRQPRSPAIRGIGIARARRDTALTHGASRADVTRLPPPAKRAAWQAAGRRIPWGGFSVADDLACWLASVPPS